MRRSSLSFALSMSATRAFLPSSSSRRQPAHLPLAAPQRAASPPSPLATRLRMSFMADGSDYKPETTDYGEGGDDANSPSDPLRGGEVDMADVPVTEEIPVPASKNNVGNRFLALAFDRDLSTRGYGHDDEGGGEEGGGDDALWRMHHDRVALSEDHVMWARKQNLYNETFNAESMADVLWSHQLLSSDLRRAVGHAMCIDSPTLDDCREALSRDPLVRSLLGAKPGEECDASSVPLYRWRQIRDHTLRRDDGRDGLPTMMVAFDRPEAAADGLREETFYDHLEYLIRSERVIAAGPLHLATEEKADPKSTPVGSMILFNAKDRDDAVDFTEGDPAARAGLYETVTVHRYNSLDVTGKFVSENLYVRGSTYQMKEAMEHWGYPVDDLQTKWLNW